MHIVVLSFFIIKDIDKIIIRARRHFFTINMYSQTEEGPLRKATAYQPVEFLRHCANRECAYDYSGLLVKIKKGLVE